MSDDKWTSRESSPVPRKCAVEVQTAGGETYRVAYGPLDVVPDNVTYWRRLGAEVDTHEEGSAGE